MRETVARFQRIFSGSGYGLWEWDLTTQRIDWSGGFWERLGYLPEDELHICDANHIWTYIHPDDHQASTDSMREHLRTGEPFNSAYRVRMKNGGYIWTQVRGDSIRAQSDRRDVDRSSREPRDLDCDLRIDL